MEKQIPTISLETVTGLMQPTYELIDISFREDLDHHHDRIFHCIEERSGSTLKQETDELYSDARVEGMHGIIDDLQEQCIEAGHDKQQVEALFTTYAEQIQNAIFDRDKSDVLRLLLGNTLPIPGRIELRSNYDCINSHRYESQDGYSYFESYFGDMVDALNLSPSRVKWRLDQLGIRTCGAFPRYKERNGKELVSYDDFCRELLSSHCPANLFTVLATLDPMELYRRNFNMETITVPAGNRCGLFSSWSGGGSLLRMPLLRPLTIHPYDANTSFRLVPDTDCDVRRSIQRVYGSRIEHFGEKLSVAA